MDQELVQPGWVARFNQGHPTLEFASFLRTELSCCGHAERPLEFHKPGQVQSNKTMRHFDFDIFT